MMSMRGTLILMTVFGSLSACGGGGSATDGDLGAIGSLDAPVAGKTMSCTVAGSQSTLTFGSNGGLSGKLLNESVTGRWYVNGGRTVHANIRAGSIAVHDDLEPQGGRWVGRLATCR